MSKLAHAGASTTVSPGDADANAVRTADDMSAASCTGDATAERLGDERP